MLADGEAEDATRWVIIDRTSILPLLSLSDRSQLSK